MLGDYLGRVAADVIDADRGCRCLTGIGRHSRKVAITRVHSNAADCMCRRHQNS